MHGNDWPYVWQIKEFNNIDMNAMVFADICKWNVGYGNCRLIEAGGKITCKWNVGCETVEL